MRRTSRRQTAFQRGLAELHGEDAEIIDLGLIDGSVWTKPETPFRSQPRRYARAARLKSAAWRLRRWWATAPPLERFGRIWLCVVLGLPAAFVGFVVALVLSPAP